MVNVIENFLQVMSFKRKPKQKNSDAQQQQVFDGILNGSRRNHREGKRLFESGKISTGLNVLASSKSITA